MPPQFPRPIRIESTKYNGSAHYRLEATLLSHEGSLLTAVVVAGTILDGYRGYVEVRSAFTALLRAMYLSPYGAEAKRRGVRGASIREPIRGPRG